MVRRADYMNGDEQLYFYQCGYEIYMNIYMYIAYVIYIISCI